MPALMDIAIQRNEDWSRDITIRDEAAPIDITGWSFLMQVKRRLNNATPIDAAAVSVVDAPNGKIEVALPAVGALHSYGDPLHTYQLPYDLIAIEPDGYRTALIAGNIILSRGVSQ